MHSSTWKVWASPGTTLRSRHSFTWGWSDIHADALENHGVAEPAGHVCDRLGLRDQGRCTLAKFIDEYNYLTIT